MLLSEAFTLSLQRTVPVDVTSLKRQRCNDSVNASLSGELIRAGRVDVGSSLQRQRVTLNRRHAAQRIPPNKRIQRTVLWSASLLMRCRAAADPQS